jgi:hypothetical protein
MAVIRILALVLAALTFASIQPAASQTVDVCAPSCAEECRADYAECRQDAREALKLAVKECLDLNCRTAIGQARRICAAQPDSQECADARAHAETCIQRCRAVGQQHAEEHIAKCREEARACLAECRGQ